MTPRARARVREISDTELAAFLAHEALLEIRVLARRAKMSPEEASPAEVIDQIDELADFCRDMQAAATLRQTTPWRHAPSRREQAMHDRPMIYPWNVASEERRAWILRRIDEAGYQWTPPPALPTPLKGVPPLSLLAGWPVKTPPGCRPLPRRARCLKALDRDGLFALYQQAQQLQLGLGTASPWLYAHLRPDAIHYLFPDPRIYGGSGPDAGRRSWECRVLVRMIDGEQVYGSLAVHRP
ncbi:hypothetical protein [Streptomyces telluris]|uniref:Uncharacterized protein n=1 Tax=Streptomyces telluris TaxID=2720021 RepID=A0A9X2LKV7_9ACTN|nr:hypothetical protein [Streptomyces telluris]MCQ8773065.1 hypothetical protein [Streptomyces telluris]